MTPLCFIDTETTGVHPDRRAWEIAMILRDGGGQHEQLIQVTDVDLSNADPFGLQIGGFYNRATQFTGEPPGSGTHQMTEMQAAWCVWRMTRGAHLVGAVPDFDARTLDPMLRRHGLIPAWHYHLIDVEAMAVGYLSARIHAGEIFATTEPPWKSDDLSRDCGVQPPTDDERHSAMGDAKWAMRWYDAMTATQ
jgi:hypothetical protein